MSAVVGIDLSTHQIDLVKVDETTNDASWCCVTLEGADAWARTLDVRGELRLLGKGWGESAYWQDVYLVAIEAPYGRGHVGATSLLNRIVGAVATSLPSELRHPANCWIVRPDEWKTGLGLRRKPSEQDMEGLGFTWQGWRPDDQNARDAAYLALWARNENAKGVAA